MSLIYEKLLKVSTDVHLCFTVTATFNELMFLKIRLMRKERYTMSLTCKHFIYRVFYYILSLSGFASSGNFFFNTVSNSLSLYALITHNLFTSHLFLWKVFWVFPNHSDIWLLCTSYAELNSSLSSVQSLSPTDYFCFIFSVSCSSSILTSFPSPVPTLVYLVCALPVQPAYVCLD